ncbi:hypothetical protein LEP1GSC194_1179 [Leptospira alstonii serovar Sichuan str. 79601]|uniref:Uncharacterized protein n=1 Tax=Leptospira alstonii serovar Sichuan str. 79601 TaxID=1218565 RepID=M6CSM1_9LEPT|nr:hypothetical protein LEP1GSC194_1179 [Leptospira alstonii serovar Sichuan str. 79601]
MIGRFGKETNDTNAVSALQSGFVHFGKRYIIRYIMIIA